VISFTSQPRQTAGLYRFSRFALKPTATASMVADQRKNRSLYVRAEGPIACQS
jgi:hypothetical protein